MSVLILCSCARRFAMWLSVFVVILLYSAVVPAQGPTIVKDFCPGTCSSNPTNLANVNGTVMFSITVPSSARSQEHQLWKTDGTAAGTVLVKGGFFEACGSLVCDPVPLKDFTSANGKLFFISNGNLWMSDGTDNGTKLIEQFGIVCTEGCDDSTDFIWFVFNSSVFFVGEPTLWKTDGTVKILIGSYQGINQPGILLPAQGFPPAPLNGSLFFFSSDPLTLESGLYETDGSFKNPTLIKNISCLSQTCNLGELVSVNNLLLFTVGTPHLFGCGNYQDVALWRSDGTANGTFSIGNLGAIPYCPPLTNFFTSAGGKALFTIRPSGHSPQLWKSDGTSGGTTMIREFTGGGFDSDSPVNVNGTLFFAAHDATNGVELWKSDGTASGTVMVKDICPGSCSSNPAFLTNVNGTLIFAANDGVNGTELWKSDGTAQGTVLIADINPGPASSSPTGLTQIGPGTLLFAATDDTHGTELWSLSDADFTMSLVGSSPTITAGQSANIQINTSGPAGVTNPVGFSCVSGVPTNASCSFNSPSVAMGGSTTLTISTAPRSSAAAPSVPSFLAMTLGSMGLLGMLWAGRLRRGRRSPVLPLLTIFLLAMAMVACGGGGSNPPPPPPPSGGTPSGTYSITVTATSGIASHNAVITLTVK